MRLKAAPPHTIITTSLLNDTACSSLWVVLITVFVGIYPSHIPTLPFQRFLITAAITLELRANYQVQAVFLGDKLLDTEPEPD
jgi:hypothetical protein